MRYFLRRLKLFTTNCHGVAIIEVAVALPVLIFLILGTIEFGLFFTKELIVMRAISTVSNAIQQNPNPSDESIHELARNAGVGFVDLSASPNYVCAQAYATAVQQVLRCVVQPRGMLVRMMPV